MHIEAAGYIADRLAVFPTFDRLALLVRGQLVRSAQALAVRLRPRPSF